MATVSVLCTRVRVEEKQIVAALAVAGVPALPLDPCRSPLPVGPVPPPPSAAEAGGVAADFSVDRYRDRTVAAAVLPIWRSAGAVILDAGIAASGDRLAVASTLAAAGVPRPESRLVCSEAAALAALEEIGYPATLMPLLPGATEIAIRDRDIAEAILEHRNVLGAKNAIVALIQSGMSQSTERVTVLVVDGRAVGLIDAVGRASNPARFAEIAESAASVIGATVAGIEMALTAAGLVVWDVQPVPEFRAAKPLGDVSVAEAIAELAVGKLADDPTSRQVHVELSASRGREMTDDIALSA